MLPVDLECTEVDAFFHPRRRLSGRGLPLGHLAHALARCIIDVVRPLAHAAVIDHLLLGSVKLILEIPIHDSKVGHAGHVAMLVVGVAGAPAIVLTGWPGVDEAIGFRNS